MAKPSISSPVFSAGISVDPSDAIAYENGSLINVTVTLNVPFVCGPQVHASDCHLSVQIVQNFRNDAAAAVSSSSSSSPLAISRCQIQFPSGRCNNGQQQDSYCSVEYFSVVAVTDFIARGQQNVTIQLVLTSYGDSWWHGYQLPNVSVQVIVRPIIHKGQ